MPKYTVTIRFSSGKELKTEHNSIQLAEDAIDHIYKENLDVVSSKLDYIETTPVEYKSPYANQQYKKLMRFDKEILAIRIIENSKTNIHLQQLKALCEGLQIPNIDRFVLLSPEHAGIVGIQITTII